MKILHVFRTPVGGLFRHVQLVSSASLHAASVIGNRFTKKVVGPACSNSLAVISWRRE